jgi:hypothetical protein
MFFSCQYFHLEEWIIPAFMLIPAMTSQPDSSLPAGQTRAALQKKPFMLIGHL